jgi:hypothetical protein
MAETVTESIPERPVKVFPESRMGIGIPEHFAKAKVGFWSSLARVAMRIHTQLVKSAEGEKYYTREPERVRGSGHAIVWFGRMMLWPDRLWSNPSESNRFALEREIKKWELASRGISPK